MTRPETNTLALFGAALLATASVAPGCVDLGAFTTILAGYDDECRRVAEVWREQADGTLAKETVRCEFVVGDTEANSELLKACQFEGLAPCDGADVVTDQGQETAVDAMVDAPPEASTDAGPDVEVSLELPPEVLNTPPVIATPTAEVMTVVESGGQFTARAVVGQSLNLSFLAADTDASSLVQTTVSVTGGSLSPNEAGFAQSFPYAPPAGGFPHSVVLTGTALAAGTVELTVSADDGAGGTDSVVVLVHIKAAPTVVPPVTSSTGQLFGDLTGYVYRIAPGAAFEVMFSGTDAASVPLVTEIAWIEGTLDASELGLAQTLPLVTPAGSTPQTSTVSGLTTVPGYAVVRYSVSDDIGGVAAVDLRIVVMGDGADFNGDGLADFAVGAPDTQGGGPGMASIVFGRKTPATSVEPDVVITGEANGDMFGSSLTHGDFNRDGYTDLVVGAPGSQKAAEDGGAIYLFFGSPALEPVLGVTNANLSLVGSKQQSIGNPMAVADFNADGALDLAVGMVTPYQDGTREVRVLYGPLKPGVINGASSSVFSGPDSSFGSGLGFGDIDGDMELELVVAASTYSGYFPVAGVIFVFEAPASGAPTGFLDAAFSLRGAEATGQLGLTGRYDLDVTGDGIHDFVYFDGGGPTWSRIGSMFAGSTALPAWSDEPSLGFDGAEQFGKGICRSVPDLNGDGNNDVVTSQRENDQWSVRLFSGGPALADEYASIWMDNVDVPSGHGFGYRVDVPGDLDGNGSADIVITSPNSGLVYVFGGGDALNPAGSLATEAWLTVAAPPESVGFGESLNAQ